MTGLPRQNKDYDPEADLTLGDAISASSPTILNEATGSAELANTANVVRAQQYTPVHPSSAGGSGANSSANVPMSPKVTATRAKSPPTLPRRQNTAGPGSAHTTYVAPSVPHRSQSMHTSKASDPPPYHQPSYVLSPMPQVSENATWREPEVVPSDDSLMLPSEATAVVSNEPQEMETSEWAANTTAQGWDYSPSSWGLPDEQPSATLSSLPPQTDLDGRPMYSLLEPSPGEPAVQNRSMDEERNWWDSEKRKSRPGRGVLPPLMADMLHNPEHSLFMVSVTSPEIHTSPPHPSGTSQKTTAGHPSSPPSGTSSSSATPGFNPPTDQEIREAVPHPNAYYCRKHNGWVLLSWKSSSILPPLAPSFTSPPHPPLPDQSIRKRITSCISEHSSGQLNKTHHFHVYERAVDAKNLSTPFERKAWERAGKAKMARRKVTINSDDQSMQDVLVADQGQVHMQVDVDPNTIASSPPKESDSSRGRAASLEATPDLLDLYVCCQCSFYVLASDVIPGVIPVRYVDEFTSEKMRNPPAGKSREVAAVGAWETILTILENKLWRGNDRSLPVMGKFHQKIGWSHTTQKVFESFGFYIGHNKDQEMLSPPQTNLDTEQGRSNRERLLRVWVEVSAYLVDFQRRFATALKDYRPHKLWVKAESAREVYQTAIGAHVDQIPRGKLQLVQEDPTHWTALGMTSTSYDLELLQFAYLAQCRCDPARTMDYYTALSYIAMILNNANECPPELETFIVSESSRGRFSTSDFMQATRTLGFGADNDLRVDFEDDVGPEFIEGAWRDAIRRSWFDPNGTSKRRDLNDAFRIVAEAMGNKELWKRWDEENTFGMNPEKAYSTLEVPENVDEDMLITVYGMRVEDQPSQLDRMKNALRVVAQYTGSERLMKYLETGSDPGVVVAATRPDWPRGLNQLGNTCYLNSLLQYFYTIKELRDAISPIGDMPVKFGDDHSLKDDDLKHHRVGGRMVTRREVIRSRKFVNQLANLFRQLEHNANPAVTPTIELAKLALVTSKDEEEDVTDKSTPDSNDTDATLVDEGVAPSSDQLSSSPTSSILGKRPRALQNDRRKTGDEMPDMEISTVSEGKEKVKEGYVVVSRPTSPVASPTSYSQNPDWQDPVSAGLDKDGDTVMDDAERSSREMQKAPPLPPRPPRQTSTSDMMFGKQHDVAECMDNCMFQMETALLEFDQLETSDDSKRSVVKRLFYGKLRQRISLQPEDGNEKSKSSIHEREDYFSHLPVNVSEESFDLYDGLSRYFDDVIEFEGKKARMEMSLAELPPILQIQLQRVQFNRETLQAWKSQTYVKFGESIFMDRFLADAPKDKKVLSKTIQAELNACRERIYSLTQGSPMPDVPFVTALDVTYQILRNSPIPLPEADEDLIEALEKETLRLQAELTKCRERASELKEQLEELWRDERSAEYELTAVFIHRGASPSFGHYFIYQRWLPDRKDEWFKYNDSDVAVATKEEVLADTTGNTANPYLLVFSRKGSNIVQTVHRSNPSAILDSQS